MLKVKMKNLRTGSTTEMTFGGNDKVKRAQIDKKKCNTCIIQEMHLYLWMEKHMNKLKFQLKI